MLHRARRPAAVVAVLAVIAGVLTTGSGILSSPEPVTSVELHGQDAVGLSAAGGEMWRHRFPSPVRRHDAHMSSYVGDFDGRPGAEAIIVVGTPRHAAVDDERLYAFSDTGRLLWSWASAASLRFGDDVYAPPWSAGPVTVNRTGEEAHVLWAIHHHTWWPWMLVKLDHRGNVVSQFVHAGWITSIAAQPDGTVVAAGYNNAEESEFAAVLDHASWPGTNPPVSGAAFACADCPTGRPLRYVLVPRSELSVAEGTERQTALIHSYEYGIEIRIVQNPRHTVPAELILHLTSAGEPRSVRYSDSYWEWHRRLELEGKIRHASGHCPERGGATVRFWDRASGWSTRRVGN